jgi:NADH-quinone oxidoreductase subunit N
MTLCEFWSTCGALLPELILGVAICVLILADMFTPLNKSRQVCGVLALLGLAAAFGVTVPRMGEGAAVGSVFGGAAAVENFTQLFRLMFFASTAGVVFFSMRTRELAGYRHGEYYSLLLGASLSASLLIASRNLILFVVALETLSMCSYVLAGFIKHERISTESGLKYLLYGAVASGVMLFGISYLYGMTGTVQVPEVTNALVRLSEAGTLNRETALLAFVLLLTGLGFKMAVVPFQFWAPDVYQGAPTPVTAFLAVVSKIAGFGGLMVILSPLYVAGNTAAVVSAHARAMHLPLLLGIIAVLTMTYGNLVALRQTDIKRLFAYSSIAHAGYLLMGLAVFNAESLRAVLVYFVIYLIMNLGAFWLIVVLVDRLGGSDLARFRGVRFKAPFLFWTMFIFLVSLTGLPPTSGFAAKLLVFGGGCQGWVGGNGGGGRKRRLGALTPEAWAWFGLVVAGVINSAISLVYYMKIARVMAFEEVTDEKPIPMNWLDRSVAITLAVATLALLYFSPVLALVDRAL